MLQHNGVFSFIEIDGQELSQYGIEILPEENTITCWIACQPDKVPRPPLQQQLQLIPSLIRRTSH